MSVPPGGDNRGIVIGLVAAGIGCPEFCPAAVTRPYPIFFSAPFVPASVITFLQVSANPYLANLGNPETASSRLTPAAIIHESAEPTDRQARTEPRA
jgi:MFS transporter, FHS family, L-fucose permease